MSDITQTSEELHLEGEVCPYTFVKAKLALEEMEAGQLLRVIVDNPESAENVPRSVANEGHEVLSVAKTGDATWVITVKKKR